MILRPARATDAPAICEIANAIIRDTLITFTTEERTVSGVARDITARGSAFLVAEQDGQVAGFATYAAFRGGPGYARTCEHSIQLASEVRGAGIGRALMTRLEDVARAAGHHVMVAGVSSANPTGSAFHRAIGFVDVGHLPQVGFKQGKWLDLILLQKFLTPAAQDGTDSPQGAG